MTRERGGEVTATCGVCGLIETVQVRPSLARHSVPLIIERALRRAGWQFLPPWEWAHRTCLVAARKGVRAGHVQLPLF